MKIAIYDQDMQLAAKLYKTLQSMKGVSVEYFESVNDPAMSHSTVVIADPSPSDTRDWLQDFRQYNGRIPLILVSSATDLLSGSYGDGCYAITKPYIVSEVIDILRFIALGKQYEVHTTTKHGKQIKQH